MSDNMTSPSESDILAAFGITQEDTSDASTEVSNTDNAETEESAVASKTADGEEKVDQEPSKESLESGNNTKSPSNDFDSKAFAKMRMENAAMAKSLGMVAKTLGINTNNLTQDQISNMIQEKALEAIAKEQKIDPEILKRLDHLEAINMEYTRMQAERTIEKSISDIRQKFNATEDDIKAFVGGLIASGYDVSAPGANLESEFIKQNFDRILQNKINEAVASEQARAAKGSDASKPSAKVSAEKQETSQEYIDTMDGLEAFLNNARS